MIEDRLKFNNQQIQRIYMKKISALIVSTIFLTACQQGGAGYDNNQNAYKGAGIGAGLGAVAGALTANDEHRWRNAAAGAAIGGLAGAGVGTYMDNQESEMRQATAGTGIDVSRQGNDLILNMPSNITFAHNSSNIQSSLRPTLNNVANILTNYPQTIVEIYGHTDSSGGDSYNLDLSDRRAAAVANYLSARGVTQKVITTGLGESQPITSNSSKEGRAQNRRVEIKISPISQ